MRENIFGSKETQVHPFISAKIPCLRQHKQAVTLHLDDRALGSPFLLEPSERGSCGKHHLLEWKRDREGDRRRDKALGGVRYSRVAPGLCTPPLHPRHRLWHQPGLSIPQHSRTSRGFQPTGKCRDGGQRKPGLPALPPLPGAAAQPLFPCPRAADRHNGAAPDFPSADSEHNGRATVSRHGQARWTPRCQPPPPLPRTDSHQTEAQPTAGFRRAFRGKLRQGVNWLGLGPPDPGGAQDTGDTMLLPPGHDERPCPSKADPSTTGDLQACRRGRGMSPTGPNPTQNKAPNNRRDLFEATSRKGGVGQWPPWLCGPLEGEPGTFPRWME